MMPDDAKDAERRRKLEELEQRVPDLRRKEEKRRKSRREEKGQSFFLAFVGGGE